MKNILNNLIKIFTISLIVSFFSSCNEEEINYTFDGDSAPSEFSVDLVSSGDDNETVTITPTAQNVSQFEVFFGEEENETPVQVLPGGSTSYTYSELGEYTIRVIAYAASGLTSEFIQVIEGGEEIIIEVEKLEFPIDHESTELEYTWGGFGNANPAVIANPDASGENTSATVLEVNKAAGAETWAGTALGLDTPIDFSETNNISVKVWSPKANTPILFKLENIDATITAEVLATTTAVNTWETLIFDMSISTIGVFDAANEYVTAIVFPDFGNVGNDEIFYFDDINTTTDSPVTVEQLPQLPLDLESSSITYEWGGFGNAAPAIIANPDASGINKSATVLEVNKGGGAETWAGVSLALDGAIDFSSSTIVSVKVWSPRVGTPILFKVEDTNSAPDANGNPSVVAEVQSLSTVANAWEELTFDMSEFAGYDPAAPYDKVVLFADFGNVGNGEIFYFDDIMIIDGNTTTTSRTLNFEESYTLTSFDGGGAMITANPDTTGNPSANVLELIKGAGQVWAGSKITVDPVFSLITNTQVKVKVWSPRVGLNLLLKFEDAVAWPDTTASAEITATSTVSNAWEELTFDFTGIDTSVVFNNLVLIMDNGTAGDGSSNYTIYVDDIIIN